MNLNDNRVAYVLEIIDQDDTNEITCSTYNKVEDFLIEASQEIVSSTYQEAFLKSLSEAGFSELAEKLKILDKASDAYDWARENL